MPAVTALYPLHLEIQTPYGLAVLPAPPPTVLQARRLHEVRRSRSVQGRAILSRAQEAEGWELTLAIPERNGVPLDVARPLQQCKQGDDTVITENYTDRAAVRIWAARVMQPDTGNWVSGNPEEGDRFTLQLQFFAYGYS